jgi:hypothetical protein
MTDVATPDAATDRASDRLPRDVVVAIACAVVAVLASLAACLASQDGRFSPTALVKMSSSEPLAAVARASDPHFVLVHPVEHYDGVYYYAIARDPFLSGREHTLIDQPAYRYGHPFYGWLARVVALGRVSAIPAALLLVSLAAAGAAAFALSRLSWGFGRSPWVGLLVACSPGLLYAVTVSTTEMLAAALLLLAVLAWTRARIVVAGVLMVALCLTKETYVVVPAGLLAWEAVEWWRRRGRPDRVWWRAAALAGGPAALLAWESVVRARLGSWPGTGAPGNVAAPLTGWRHTFSFAHLLSGGSYDQSEMGAIVGPVLIAVAVVLLAAAAAGIRMRTPLDGIVLGLVAVMSTLDYLTLAYPHELVRNPSVALLVALSVLLVRPRRAAATDFVGGSP